MTKSANFIAGASAFVGGMILSAAPLPAHSAEWPTGLGPMIYNGPVGMPLNGWDNVTKTILPRSDARVQFGNHLCALGTVKDANGLEWTHVKTEQGEGYVHLSPNYKTAPAEAAICEGAGIKPEKAAEVAAVTPSPAAQEAAAPTATAQQNATANATNATEAAATPDGDKAAQVVAPAAVPNASAPGSTIPAKAAEPSKDQAAPQAPGIGRVAVLALIALVVGGIGLLVWGFRPRGPKVATPLSGQKGTANDGGDYTPEERHLLPEAKNGRVDAMERLAESLERRGDPRAQTWRESAKGKRVSHKNLRRGLNPRILTGPVYCIVLMTAIAAGILAYDETAVPPAPPKANAGFPAGLGPATLTSGAALIGYTYPSGQNPLYGEKIPVGTKICVVEKVDTLGDPQYRVNYTSQPLYVNTKNSTLDFDGNNICTKLGINPYSINTKQRAWADLADLKAGSIKFVIYTLGLTTLLVLITKWLIARAGTTSMRLKLWKKRKHNYLFDRNTGEYDKVTSKTETIDGVLLVEGGSRLTRIHLETLWKKQNGTFTSLIARYAVVTGFLVLLYLTRHWPEHAVWGKSWAWVWVLTALFIWITPFGLNEISAYISGRKILVIDPPAFIPDLNTVGPEVADYPGSPKNSELTSDLLYNPNA
jgi:hypothetical protein